MGITLQAIVEVARDIEGSSWYDISIWRFGKNFRLSQNISDAIKTELFSAGWPEQISFAADDILDQDIHFGYNWTDSNRIRKFLSILVDNTSNQLYNQRYLILESLVNSLLSFDKDYKVRILFYES